MRWPPSCGFESGLTHFQDCLMKKFIEVSLIELVSFQESVQDRRVAAAVHRLLCGIRRLLFAIVQLAQFELSRRR